jgi:hypothetical protein
VVEKMNVLSRSISVNHSSVSDEWMAQFLSYRRNDGKYVVNENGTSVGPTAPLAICIAALKAVGVEESEIQAAMKN